MTDVISDKTEPPEENAPHSTNSDEFWDLNASHLVTSALTIVLIVLGYLQYHVYLGQAKIMTTQAEISKTQNDIILSGTMAHLFISSIKVDRPIGPGTIVYVSFKNFGQTPAILNNSAAKCSYFDSLPSPDVEDEITDYSSFSVLGSSEQLSDLGREIKATASQFDNAKNNIGSIRCIFNLNYYNVRNIERKSGVCLKYFKLGEQEGFIICPEYQYRYTLMQ